MDTYSSITVTRRGGLDAVTVLDRPLREPAAGEVRAQVLAAPVRQSRRGDLPAAGGPRVRARRRRPGRGGPLILNHLVAQRVPHRLARVEAGQCALVIGASGGVGTAFLELGRLAGLRLYGTASPAKHPIVGGYGATPIDYRTGDLVAAVRARRPEGVDYVFNAMGPEHLGRGLALLRRGGVLVEYGAPQRMRALFALLSWMITTNLLPNGTKIIGYGTHRQGVSSLKEDWATLFRLLRDGLIHPVIADTYPLLRAKDAYAALEIGRVGGNLVLAMQEAEP